MRKRDYGQYMTPQSTAEWMSAWLADKTPTTILEPSCGNGVFIQAIFRALTNKDIQLMACELDDKLFRESLYVLHENFEKRNYDIRNCCFLEYYLANISLQLDVVIGNPPFISHLTATIHFKQKSERICRMSGIKYSKMMNTWMLFIMASLMMLKKGGYLAFILPTDIITAPWAEEVRKLFQKTKCHVAIIETDQPMFPDVQQATCIVLAQKGMADHKVRHFTLPDLKAKTAEELWQQPKRDVGTRWNLAQISEKAQELVTYLYLDRDIKRLVSLAHISVPPPTGANKFFYVNAETIRKYDLMTWCYPVFSYAKQCTSILYEYHDWALAAEDNEPVYLLMMPPDVTKPPHSRKPANYIAKYRAHNPSLSYKCSQHTPEWWCLPAGFTRPACFLLKRCGDVPRMIRNWADVIVGDCAMKVEPKRNVNPDVLALAFMNPLTMLTAELYGKKFGGGVLEISPRAADELLIPWPKSLTGACLHDLSVLNTPEEIVNQHGKLLMYKVLSADEIVTISDAWQTLRNRRLNMR